MLSRILETEGNKTFKLYERGDLVKATHGFHKANIVGEGAHGTVHKVTLGTDPVAVKRCKQIKKSQTDEFVQELVCSAASTTQTSSGSKAAASISGSLARV